MPIEKTSTILQDAMKHHYGVAAPRTRLCDDVGCHLYLGC